MKRNGFPLARCALALGAALLAGCAAQSAFRDGEALQAQGRDEDALLRFEEASRLEPTDARYRMSAVQARERLGNMQVARAESLLREGRYDQAESVLREAATLGAATDRVQGLTRALETRRRADAWMAEAQAAFGKKDFDTARARLKSVLLENPAHEGARRLSQRIDEVTAKPAPEAALAAAYRKPITIEFKDAALRSVFEVISRTSGLNFLFDKDVRTDQKTSIFLKNSTIEAAVQLTLLTNQLEQRVLDANTVLVYPNTAAKQKDYQPLSVKSFYLANADAKNVAASLKALLKTRDVVVDEKLNLIILRDSPESIRLAEKVVALHDLPEPEVMLEVEVLEVKRTRLLDLGVRWPSQATLSPLPSASGGPLTLADLQSINRSRVGVVVDPFKITANKTDTDARILANPRIRARNHEKAKILIGERVPNITTTATSTGFVAESVNYVDVGLKLDVEPAIYLDGEVAIKIALEVSNIISQVETKAGSVAYQIGTRTAQTVLRLRDGENQILAGLINDEDRRSGNRVPGLGDIPIAGRLFGAQSDDSTKTEIVLSITPRIVRNVRRPDAALLEFESGTESSLGARVAAASAAPAVAIPPTTSAPARPQGAGSAPAAANAATSTAQGTGPAAIPAAPNLGTPAAAPSAGTASIHWQGPSQLRTGDTFALQVLMQTDQPVVSVPFALGFDPQVLQVMSVSEGDLLRQGGAQTAFANRVDPKGQIVATVTRSGNTGASGQGIVATVNFRVAAVAATQTQVQMLTAVPVGLGGSQVTLAPVPNYVVQLSAGAP